MQQCGTRKQQISVYKCNTCNQTYNSYGALNTHYINEHKSDFSTNNYNYNNQGVINKFTNQKSLCEDEDGEIEIFWNLSETEQQTQELTLVQSPQTNYQAILDPYWPSMPTYDFSQEYNPISSDLAPKPNQIIEPARSKSPLIEVLPPNPDPDSETEELILSSSESTDIKYDNSNLLSQQTNHSLIHPNPPKSKPTPNYPLLFPFSTPKALLLEIEHKTGLKRSEFMRGKFIIVRPKTGGEYLQFFAFQDFRPLLLHIFKGVVQSKDINGSKNDFNQNEEQFQNGFENEDQCQNCFQNENGNYQKYQKFDQNTEHVNYKHTNKKTLIRMEVNDAEEMLQMIERRLGKDRSFFIQGKPNIKYCPNGQILTFIGKIKLVSIIKREFKEYLTE
ncbi:Zinc_finger C2H2 superfamily [Hexamita inflata]|uniref:Zinc finger C2H2 superfamily n=1 Tax=Hexamita inflata TaxID=28002 RepID=A0AA86PQP7_9EUKA|nr:Zinc finger C2H2 superfamily [Hexamita inflata]